MPYDISNLKPGDKVGELIFVRELTKEERNSKKNRRGLFLCKCGKSFESYFFTIKERKFHLCNSCTKKGYMKRSPKGECAQHAIYCQYRTTATKYNIEFRLSKKDFLDTIILPCYYCGSPPYREIKRIDKGNFLCNGIDRVNPNLGYISGNCVPSCYICNRAKSTLSKDSFLEHFLSCRHYLNKLDIGELEIHLKEYEVKQLENVYYQYKYRISKQGNNFNILFEDFIKRVVQDCYYCGSKPNSYGEISKNRRKLGPVIKYNGLTQIKRGPDYTIENSRQCCQVCRQAKINLDENDFIDWLERFYKYQIDYINSNSNFSSN